ncbi:LANO_0F08042g1_1 [Lachancea nothofagi CBS 11611]|uniref:LANO_0F08042g1_1 n=1 Tax=Lachancea nothofagi CBS 11611 TaxID=1266666 RepID=A0A1G4K9B0_9SACH|nr:LANO_0F08042g1_1 [Lachancea nothofagi CBS 11611]
MSVKKKSEKSDDKTWSVVSFDNNTTLQRDDRVSVETISEEGLCDDVLSNTSSDECDLPMNAMGGPKVTEFGFDTLVAQTEIAPEIPINSAQSSINHPLSRCFAPLLENRVTRAVAQLQTWQIVLLTSSTTLFLTCVVRALLQASATSVVHETSTAPYFTNHGATYRDVDFVLPFGDVPAGVTKYIVDFENRVAYPIVPEVPFWESAKASFNQKASALREDLKEFGCQNVQKLSDGLHLTNSAIQTSLGRVKSSTLSKFSSVPLYLKSLPQTVNQAFRGQVVKRFTFFRKAFQMQASEHLMTLHGKYSNCERVVKSIPHDLERLGPKFKCTWLKALTNTRQFQREANVLLFDKWNNTMEMLRLKKTTVKN